MVFNEPTMLQGTLSDTPVGSHEKSSVQVEHFVDVQRKEIYSVPDEPISEDSSAVEDAPIVSQSPPPPKHSVTVDRTRRQPKPVRRLIEECNIAYALSVAEEIEGNAEPSTYSEAISSINSNNWVIAMNDEMESLEKNGTWELVKLPTEKKPIRCKWIFKRKEGISPSEEVRYKARLVAKGYSQIPGIDYNNIFSSVVKHSPIRTLFSIVAMHDYELEQLDVKTAFLHGELEEDIYMDQLEVLLFLEKRT